MLPLVLALEYIKKDKEKLLHYIYIVGYVEIYFRTVIFSGTELW